MADGAADNVTAQRTHAHSTVHFFRLSHSLVVRVSAKQRCASPTAASRSRISVCLCLCVWSSMVACELFDFALWFPVIIHIPFFCVFHFFFLLILLPCLVVLFVASSFSQPGLDKDSGGQQIHLLPTIFGFHCVSLLQYYKRYLWDMRNGNTIHNRIPHSMIRRLIWCAHALHLISSDPFGIIKSKALAQICATNFPRHQESHGNASSCI